MFIHFGLLLLLYQFNIN